MPTTTSWRAEPDRYQRHSWRRPLIVLGVVIIILAVAAYAGFTAYERFATRLLTIPGCQAGTGADAIPLEFGQAADAATIAGVAVTDGLPSRALQDAYATAIQESKLENLDYGTSDSVGIFQQRPSQGWGSVAELEDPAYASRAFFNALVKVPGYATMSVADAAQDVQRSADGSAYEQWAQEGTWLAADYTATPHAVTCWYDPATQASESGVSPKENLAGAVKNLEGTFGDPGQGGTVTGVTLDRSGKSETFDVAKTGGWAAANWLVTNASSYGITQVAYDGYRWTASLTETAWQADPGSTAGSIVAS